MSEGLSVILLLGGIFTVVFGVIGAIFLIKFLNARQKAEASRNWPTAAGTIEFSSISSSTNTDSDGFSSTTFAPMVQYSYEVLGTPYHSRRIGFGLKMTGSYKGAATASARYPMGKPVIVHYDPQNPQEAVLEHDVINKGPTILLFSVFLAVGILAFLISSGIIVYNVLLSQ